MLKRIEIENFESHLKSVFEFSKGFNIICGESNAGKTAIIRALRLVLYNQWNPESLRIGTKHCRIKVETEKGSVTVIRGNKENKWIVERDGIEQEFNKIGKDVLPEVMNVTGIRMIKLGSFESMPNIMDQLEGHFLLSEMDGENMSGSLRAQIMDEISGLSGMEELIRVVSLDNLRISKEIKETEVNNTALISRLYNEEELVKEIGLIEIIDTLFKNIDNLKSTNEQIENMITSNKSSKIIISDLDDKIKRYENLDIIERYINNCSKDMNLLKDINDTIINIASNKENLKNNMNKLEKYENLDVIEKTIEQFILLEDNFQEYNNFLNDYKRLYIDLKEIEKVDKKIDYNAIINDIDSIRKKKKEKIEIENFIKQDKTVNLDVARINKNLKDVEKDLKEIDEKYQKAISEVTICPLTLKPTDESCFEV